MDACELPAFHIGTWYRVIDTPEQLKLIRGCAQPPISELQYFWDAHDRWFQAVNFRVLRKAPFWTRFTSADDLRVMEFELIEFEQIPIDFKSIYRDMMSIIDSMEPVRKAEARKELRSVEHSSEIISWYRKYVGLQKY